MTPFSAGQLEVARQITAACDRLGVGDAATKLACICCALTESSLQNLGYGDNSPATGQPTTSRGVYQQTTGYGPLTDRTNVAVATRMFLAGGPQGQRGYLGTDTGKPTWQRIQDVQQSEYDGRTNWPTRGVLPYAQNYLDRLPNGRQVMTLIGESVSTDDNFRQAVAQMRSWGINVVEMPGCYGRNNGIGWATGAPVGHINHHFVCSLNPDQGYIDGLVSMLVNGYGDTPGPVVNWFVDMHGVAYLIATEPANHSGQGSTAVRDRVASDLAPNGPAAKLGLPNDFTGNAWYSGTETQHPGDDTPYPDALIATTVAINAAEANAFGWSANRAIHHYEHTNRKTDMSWRGGVNGDGGPVLRQMVAARMTAASKPPAEEDDMPLTPDDIAKVADKVLHTPLEDGGPSLAAIGLGIIQRMDDVNGKLSVLVDPRNQNTTGTSK